ncbi:MAG: OFA family MFS transporter [Oscillospiraceae bacterium]|nr:OFA family MFS transporter [Oscillospiraceae bacterium]
MSARTKPINRGLIMFAAFLIIFCSAGNNAFSVFVEPIKELTGAGDRVMITMTLYLFTMSFFGIVSGWIVDKFGPKVVMYIGGALYGLGWVATMFITSLGGLYFWYGFVAGAGCGLIYNSTIATALRWFPEKRGTMSGLLLCAASLGPLLLAPAGAWLYDTIGVRGFAVIGIFFLVMIWAVGWILRVPEQSAEQAAQASMDKDYTPVQMLATPVFWAMLILFAIACTAGIMMVGKASPIAQVQLGITAQAAAFIVSINCIANLVGRLIIGRLCDTLGELKSLAIIFVLTIVALIGLRFSYSTAMFVVFIALLGISFGGVLVCFPPLTSKTFGVRNSGINYGIMFFGYSIGSYIGPQIASRAYDASMGVNAYSQAFLYATVVAVVGLAFNLVFLVVLAKRGKKTAAAVAIEQELS